MKLKKVPVSLLFDALSDPGRLEIVIMLLKEKELSCGQCSLDLSKSTMSHHFKVLRECGLIQKRTEGKNHFISLCEDEIEERLPGFLKILSKIKDPI